MTAVATGLAMEGRIVFTYSIGNFPTLRCLEQLRNDTCYHRANVKVVSVGGGLSYGQLGMSHHATEDLAILRALPELTVCAPGSARESAEAVDAVIARPGPAYLRLERAAPGSADESAAPFELGKARVLREGSDITLVACGGIVAEVLHAAERLSARGVSCRVLSMHTLKPLDTSALLEAAAQTGGIVTIEENTILGGLGGAVAEACLELHPRPQRFKRIGIQDTYVSTVGDQTFLRAKIGLDCDSLCTAILGVMQRN
jgi:transketolase